MFLAGQIYPLFESDKIFLHFQRITNPALIRYRQGLPGNVSWWFSERRLVSPVETKWGKAFQGTSAEILA